MAIAQKEVTFIPMEKWMDGIPEKGLILIKRFANPMARDHKDRFLAWGEKSASGYLTINKKPIEGGDYMGSRLAIRVDTLRLNLDNEEQRLLFGLFSRTDQFKSIISPSKDKKYPGSVYYIENPEEEAETWMADKKREVELVKSIDALTENDLYKMGLVFSIKGSNTVIQATLYKKAATLEGRKDLTEVLYSHDRDLIELIAVAESKGDATQKKGLWRNPKTGVYAWNTQPIGLGTDEVIAYMKKETELQYEIKKLYLKDEVETPVPQAAPKQVAYSEINTSEGKVKVVVPNREDKYKGTPTDKQIIDAYNGGEKDPGALGRKFNVHHFSIRKVLKANAASLKD